MHPLTDISVLDQYAKTSFPPGYPSDRRRFFVTVDEVSSVISYVVSSCRISQALAMYSLDDQSLVEQLIANYHSIPGGMPTLITQDQSCYQTSEGTRVAAPLVALRGSPNFRWSVGTSDVNHEISHMKSFVGDGAFTITGSTNWSRSGENDEDNECEITINAALAAQLTNRISQIHTWQLANCEQPS